MKIARKFSQKPSIYKLNDMQIYMEQCVNLRYTLAINKRGENSTIGVQYSKFA